MSQVPIVPEHQDYELLAYLSHKILTQAGGLDSFASYAPALLRQAFDEVIDAPRTNRFTLSEIEKTEKIYVGTKVEILLRNYLRFPKGRDLDLLVHDIEVDIKNTTATDWMLPREVIGRPALLVRSDERSARCDFGLVVCRPDYMRDSKNQDGKKQLRRDQHAHIWWLLRDYPYPPNFWEVLSAADRTEILAAGKASNRIASLFEKIQQRPISRHQVQALAQQADYMKRVRRNGGARDVLAPKGIAILWGLKDRAIIKHFNLGVVSPEEFISYRPISDDDKKLLRTAGHID